MGLVVGLHVGHDVSCALVRDGELVAAVQLERLSRKKNHAIASLSNVIPIQAVLAVVGAEVGDLDRIVTSFQNGSVGGFGLDRPLIEPFFDTFDPFEARHHVLSHHQAHAYCAAAYAPDVDLAVMVSDLAGSATPNGADFAAPFADWYREMTSAEAPVALKSECFSLYRVRLGESSELQHREFRVPHNGSESHVDSLGALYENVTQAVFRRPHSHGSLMAMAAFGELTGRERPMVDIDGENVTFRNDWQHEVFAEAHRVEGSDDFKLPFEMCCALAARCQTATEKILAAYAKRAARLSGAKHLALGGGTFLNILANSQLAASGLFDEVWLPSAPHDAGIAIGCAVHGAVAIGDSPKQIRRDRLGPIHPRKEIDEAVTAFSEFVTSNQVTPEGVAASLEDGSIIARSAGRSEFGPRALGARSLLGSPLLAENKDRLNRIKGRQPWRPVAPIVAKEQMAGVFAGPAHSPWMTFSHQLSEEHAAALAALRHPDGSTRAQSLEHAQDPWLHELLTAFGERTGYAVLINTSLNGPREPILETPAETIAWLLRNGDVDAALLDDVWVTRRSLDEVMKNRCVEPSPSLWVLVGPDGSRVLRQDGATVPLKSIALHALVDQRATLSLGELRALDPDVDSELWSLLVAGMVVTR